MCHVYCVTRSVNFVVVVCVVFDDGDSHMRRVYICVLYVVCCWYLHVTWCGVWVVLCVACYVACSMMCGVCGMCYDAHYVV